MQELADKIIGGEKVFDYWKELAGELEKKQGVLRVVDMDYTLFSRDRELSEVEGLAQNRGDLGPKHLFENYGMKKFIDKYYKSQKQPNDILDLLDSNTDIIITAGGSKEFQLSKARSMKALDNFRVIVSDSGIDKIPELIRYVLFELRYIPSEIIVYEDRPQYFIEYRDLIEQTLGTKLSILKVEMDGNDGYKSIEEV